MFKVDRSCFQLELPIHPMPPACVSLEEIQWWQLGQRPDGD